MDNADFCDYSSMNLCLHLILKEERIKTKSETWL